MKKITCIGAGYVGCPTMAVMADKCPDMDFVVADISGDRISAWKSDELPFYEPGLLEVVKRTRCRNLSFTTDIPSAIEDADVVFVAVNTPTKEYGSGAGCAANMSFFETAVTIVAQFCKDGATVVEKSTVPVGTHRMIERIFRSMCPEKNFRVVSNPEFLAEGTAVENLLSPDRVVLGNDDGTVRSIYEHWVPSGRIVDMDLDSAELTKLVSNAMLAQRISSINTIARLCSSVGGDVTVISKAVGMDHRIGPQFLRAGVGFGGSCFKKDVLNLACLFSENGMEDEFDYWNSVVGMNEIHADRIAADVVKWLNGTVAGKDIAVLGYSFKADTGDVRESPAVQICHSLLEEGADVKVYDPKAFVYEDGITVCSSVTEAVAGACAVLVLTDWQEFAKLNWRVVYSIVSKPAVLFDGRNFLDASLLRSIGFEVHQVGR